MELAQRTGKNLFYKLAGEGASRALAFLFYIMAARGLGAAEFGKYSFAYSFTVLFVMFADLGLNNVLIRDVGGDKTLFRKYYANANAIKTALAALCVAALWFVNIVSGYKTVYGNLIILMGIVAVETSWMEYLVSVFNAVEKMYYETFLKTFIRALMLAFGYAAIKTGAGLEGFLVSMIAAYGVGISAGFAIVSRKIHKLVFAFDAKFAGRFIIDSMPVFLSILFLMAYHHAGVVMLSFYGTPETQIGLYSIALKITEVLSVTSVMFALASLPVLSDFYSRSREMFLDAYRRTLKFAFFAGITGAVLTSVFSKELVNLLFGAGFAGAGEALAVAAWVYVFMFANHAIMQAFIILRRQTINVWSAAAALAFNIVLNMILIPRFGFMGVAAAVVATECFLFIVNGWLSFALEIRSGLLRSLWKLAVPGLVSAILILTIRPPGWAGFIASSAVFAAAIFLLKPFDADDRLYAAKLFSLSALAEDLSREK